MWTDKYIGLLYSEYNCAALVKLVYKNELNRIIDMDTNNTNLDDYSKLMQGYTQANFAKIDDPVDKCIVLMYSRSGQIGHVGLWLDYQGGYILHAHKDFKSSILEKATTTLEKNKLYGFYA